MVAPATAQSDQATDVRKPTASSNVDKPMQRLDLTHFFGHIVKSSDGKLVLLSPSTMISYQLDNQDLAKKYIGKEVKIDGKLIPPGSMIHVTGIERAPQPSARELVASGQNWFQESALGRAWLQPCRKKPKQCGL